MREGLRPLRAVLWRSLLLSSVLALAVMGGFFVLFSYDLEDVIFDRLVAAEADRQAQALASGQTPTQPAVGMSVHRGHAALPAALARELSPLLVHGEYEVVAAAVIASRVARRLSGPLEGLRRSLQSEGAALPGEDGAVAEVHALLEALRARDARIQALLERERQFNRDASHELRTPLAVAQGAVEILEHHPPQDGETFARLRDAVHQMGLLTEGILWLARERRTGEACELTSVSREVVALYDGLRSPEVAVVVEAEGAVHAPVPASVARVLLGNLVKNAFSYTRTGQVRVRVEAGCWSVSDSGEGLGAVTPERSGFGVGLSLVERLAQHFGWRVLLTPLSPHGTRAELRWPEGRSGVVDTDDGLKKPYGGTAQKLP